MQRFAALALLTALAATTPAAAENTALHTIAVMGEAETQLAPDFATIQVGVLTQGSAVATALAENSERMDKVVAALRALGIADADIRTSNFAIQPKYQPMTPGSYDEEALRAIIGFSVSNQVTVTVTDMTKIAKIIDTTVDAGANASGQVDFRVRNLTAIMDKVRAAAVASARHKAEILTAAAHVRLGPALSITDNEANTFYNNRPQDGAVETVIVTAERKPTAILPGQVTVTSQVTLVYAVQ